ncbi:MAG TPA: hypothetical protein DDY77_06515 [Clostridiales bacterium]|nr:hypothetical protein [Clostridiales bacterium]
MIMTKENKTDKLAIIGSGYMARIIAERAKELKIESHCFSNDDNSVAVNVADFFHNVSILDLDNLLLECEKIGINGVVATTELTIFPAAYVAKSMNLPGNNIEVAKYITDKTVVREKVKNIANLFQPAFWKCDGSIVPQVNYFPVIVKPIAAGGKRGLSVVNSVSEMKQAIREAQAVSKVKGALVEEYLAGGQEYSVESLSYEGRHYILQITQKDSSGPPHCVELGHHQPADLSEEMKNMVKEVVKNALIATGITNGPCHTEIKIINGRVYLIEINGRPGGDHIAFPLTELSTGYPYITGIIQAALGKLDETKLLNLEHNYCGVYFVTTQTAYLKKIFDNCDKEPWFYKKKFVSEELHPITHNDGFNTNYFMYFSKFGKPKI